MRQQICLLLSIALMSATAVAQDKAKSEKKTGELTDPVEILKKVDAAAKAVKAVKYEVTIDGTEALAERVGKVQATITATGCITDGGRPSAEKYVADCKVLLPGATQEKRISGGSDGDVFFVVHHDTKTAYEDIDPAVMGNSARVLLGGMMIEFVVPEPYSDELNGKSQELTGCKVIGGEDCYEVHVVYANENSPEAIWYFSKKDFLPRGRIDKYKLADDQEGCVRKMITKLKVDPKLGEDTFKLKVPKDYTTTDDFAPNLTP
jgi:hypothetical protein